MKTIRHIGILTAIIIISLHSSQVQAQSQKEQKAAQEAELQAKKEMLEEQHRDFAEQERHLRELEELPHHAPRSLSSTVVYSSGDSPYVYTSYDQGNQSQLTLRNTFKGSTDSSSGKFEVDESTKNFRLMIRGRVKSGEIKIMLLYPDGKVFKEQTINSSAEVTLTQSITIKDESSSKYFGSWTYKIESDEAMGDYTLSISTN